MRKYAFPIAVTALVSALLLLSTSTLAGHALDFDLWWHVIAGGGGHSSSAEYAVSGSIGQPAVGMLSSASYRLGAGFWPGIGAESPTPTPTGTTIPTATATATPTATPTGTLPPTSTPTTTPTGPPPLVVNTTDDVDDGTCNATHCSLREATRLATSGDTIAFDIPPSDPGYDALLGVWTIRPLSSYSLDYDVTIDGTTQTASRGDTNPHGPEVEVDGSNHTGGYTCFRLGSGDVLRGLVINHCGAYGVWVEGSGIVVAGNYIGTDPTGTQARPVNYDGVLVIRAQNNTIGGTIGADRNVISGNNSNGIRVSDATSQGNQIVGNYIGTDRTATSALGNGGHGIRIHAGAHDNTVGPGNTIAFNGGNGVQVDGSDSLGNSITANSIHNNGGLGINNVDGGNVELAPPVIATASATQVSGTACTNCTVEVFSDAADEGAVYEGTTTANAAGNWTFTKPGGLTGPYVTATTTDGQGNTSEFSAPVSLAPTPTATATPTVTRTASPTVTPTATGSPPPTTTPTATPTSTVSPTPGHRVYLPIVLKSYP